MSKVVTVHSVAGWSVVTTGDAFNVGWLATTYPFSGVCLQASSAAKFDSDSDAIAAARSTLAELARRLMDNGDRA